MYQFTIVMVRLLLLAAVLIAWPVTSSAQSADQKKLEERIIQLEKRLVQMEKLLVEIHQSVKDRPLSGKQGVVSAVLVHGDGKKESFDRIAGVDGIIDGQRYQASDALILYVHEGPYLRIPFEDLAEIEFAKERKGSACKILLKTKDGKSQSLNIDSEGTQLDARLQGEVTWKRKYFFFPAKLTFGK